MTESSQHMCLFQNQTISGKYLDPVSAGKRERLLVLKSHQLLKVKVKVKLLSRVWLFATQWMVAHQASPSMGFSRQEYWSGLPVPSPGDLPDPGIEPRSPALQADTLTSEPPGKPKIVKGLPFIRENFSRSFLQQLPAPTQTHTPFQVSTVERKSPYYFFSMLAVGTKKVIYRKVIYRWMGPRFKLWSWI